MLKTKMHRIRLHFGVMLVSGLLGVAIVSPEVIAQEDTPSGDVGRGVKSWADNCARCHNMRDPKEFRDDQWRAIVTHMRVRGGLTGQDARDILKFLQSAN